MKTIEENFTDWEGNVFGFGYGTGEEHTITALNNFLALCCHGPLGHAYEHEELSAALTPTVAWLLINILCHADILEYGSSPRYAWLTPKGEALKKFVNSHGVEQLIEFTYRGEDYIPCYPDHCNCSDGDCRPTNPFWDRLASQTKAEPIP